MSYYNPNPKDTKLDKAAAFVLALPYLAVSNALTMARKGLMSKRMSHQKPLQQQKAGTPAATITSNPKFLIADRVFSTTMGSLKVCFYQYSSMQVIRVVARKGKCAKEVHFTPAIANKLNVPYNIDSANTWARTVGFREAMLASAPVAVKEPVEVDSNIIEMEPATPTPSVTPAPAPALKTESLTSKNRPFTGKILSMGETLRPGRGNNPPYTTYAVKLQSEYGGLEKEFIGEHLAELIESTSVKVGDLVRLQLLGRNKFEVLVGGKSESRTRNEYKLEII